MTEKEVIMEVIGFFIVPGEREEDEQQHFEKILNFSLVSQREDERQYELNNKIERLEVLKQKMIEFKKPSFHHIAKIDRFIKFCTEKNIQSTKKYTAKEVALSYILETYSKGERLPINRVDGGYDQQRIYKIGEAKGWKGNTFMKAVRDVVKFDINKESELQKISKDWYDAVIELSENPELIKTYLQQKGLQKENP